MAEGIPDIPEEVGPDYLNLCERSVAEAKKVTETVTIQLALQKKSVEEIEKRCRELGLDVNSLDTTKSAALESVTKAKKNLDEALRRFFEVADGDKN